MASRDRERKSAFDSVSQEPNGACTTEVSFPILRLVQLPSFVFSSSFTLGVFDFDFGNNMSDPLVVDGLL